ncbi:TlpA disulfide reductase family protein [Daejeonella sp.]|uniref:TlpA family protein disulfide reductase n=1 Tax=Daejeonella sp. TaxID=2805397 RepID=UPI0030C3FC2A
MKALRTTSLFLLFYCSAYSQDISPAALIKQIQQAQSALKTATYTMDRVDTLVSGDPRRMTGKVIVQTDPADTLLGFRFRAKKDNEKVEKIYDGHIGYESNPDTKTYILMNTNFGLHNLLSGGGGHLVMPDLVKLDTSRASGLIVREDHDHYYLTINYPDLTEYDVSKRRKIVTISKQTMLPVAVRRHQETLGKVQDLYFEAKNLQINVPVFYPFTSPPFLKEYTHFVPVTRRDSRMDLANKPIPPFELESFDGKKISSADFKGKAVLLDFWEIWCGPCIESMPKIQQLYEKYKDKGLTVYGITNDLKQLPSARLYAKNKNIPFATLIGNEQIKKDYKLSSVPFYILINKEGIASMVMPAYPPNLEEEILRALK